MNETFTLKAPPTAMEFAGERFTTTMPRSQIEAEHLHRYFLAREFCRGKDVLDVASGEGFGSSLLKQVASSVVGVEIDHGAVAHASLSYSVEGLRFLQGDARAIPCESAQFDVVVSFETIEHIEEHNSFLSEIRRVLRPNGLLLISSPDRDVYSCPGKSANPFHLRELAKDEFVSLISVHFPHLVHMSQQAVVGSVLSSESGSTVPPLVFERRGDTEFDRYSGLRAAPYSVLVASSHPVELPSLSLFIEVSEYAFMLGEHRQAAEREAAIRSELERSEAARRELMAAHHALTERAQTLERMAEMKEQELSDLRSSLAATQTDL